MDRASSLIFPGSRTLGQWWRQLASWQPRGFWVGYAFVHRIEAPVVVAGEQQVEPLVHLILQALALDPTGCGDALTARLDLPPPMVQRILLDMQRAGLLTRAPTWQLTELGEHALRDKRYPARLTRRHLFPFVETLTPDGQRVGPPQFVPLAECAHADWQVDEALRFDVAALKACVAQTADWKHAHGFPLDVQALAVDVPAEDGSHVVIDRPQRVLLTLVQAGAELVGFAARMEGWTLFDRTPVLRVPATDAALLPAPPTAEVWQDAWRSWCKQRQLPGGEVDSCTLAYHPPRLEVQAPGRLVQRLQSAKSDLFKGDAWVLVGDGYLRTAAQLAVRS